MQQLVHYVCFDCRVAFKQVLTCPLCKRPMVVPTNGNKFRAPKRSDTAAWGLARRFDPRLERESWYAYHRRKLAESWAARHPRPTH
jgi:hypothetical protein